MTWKKLFLNRYFLFFILFLGYWAFFDKNNYFYHQNIKKEIKTLENEKAFYEKNIKELKQQKEYLNSDIRNLERYAREKFYMKKDGETVYVIEE
jgi:cell division protein DivIC